MRHLILQHSRLAGLAEVREQKGVQHYLLALPSADFDIMPIKSVFCAQRVSKRAPLGEHDEEAKADELYCSDAATKRPMVRRVAHPTWREQTVQAVRECGGRMNFG